MYNYSELKNPKVLINRRKEQLRILGLKIQEIRSMLISLFIHILLLVLVLIFMGEEEQEKTYVLEVGLGGFGAGMGGGGSSEKKEPEKEKEPEKNEVKKTEVSKSINKDIVANPVISSKNNESKSDSSVVGLADVKGGSNSGSGQGNGPGFGPGGPGGYGFDWGGRGTRRILSWTKPVFPADVFKEVDIKIRFIILPNGSVVSPIPLIKADTRLEDAAISALKTWRFEPLKSSQNQFEQAVIITIPFRLE